MTVRVHRFEGLDPWDHLAREEILLDDLAPGSSALLLYVNSPCVVLGKHQNPLREVRLDEAARRGIPLVRRASGGGTVYHDGGNLNWSYLGPKDSYDRDQVTRWVAEALAPLGRTLDLGDKGDLFWGGKKVSGAAYLLRRDRVLHHGTLLCRARLEDLHGVLGPTGTLTQWVGVSSRPSPVTNLDLDVEAASAALALAFSGQPIPTPEPGRGDPVFEARVAERATQRRSAAWLWDQTPAFTWEGATPVGRVRARVQDGLVEELSGLDDTNLNMSKMLGKPFFGPGLFEYIPREVT